MYTALKEAESRGGGENTATVRFDPPWVLVAPAASAPLCVLDLRGGARGSSGNLESLRMDARWLHASEEGSARPLAALALRHPFVVAAFVGGSTCAELWALPETRPVASLHCGAPVVALALCDDDADDSDAAALVAAADADACVRLWRARSCAAAAIVDVELLATLRLAPAHVSTLAMWGAACVAIGTADGGVALWAWHPDDDAHDATWLAPPGSRGAVCALHAAPTAPGDATDARALLAVIADGDGKLDASDAVLCGIAPPGAAAAAATSAA